MPEAWTAENWLITVKALGADVYEVTGNHPASSSVAPQAQAHIVATFLRDSTYTSLKNRLEHGDVEAAKLLGERLFAFLFDGDMGTAFGQWCDRVVLPGNRRDADRDRPEAETTRRVLRLLLDLPSELTNEPWECMYTHYRRLNTHLCLSPYFSVVRYVEPQLLNEERQPISVSAVNILVLDGNPPPGSVNVHLDISKEREALRRAIGKDHKEHIDTLEGDQISLTALDDYLESHESAYHILHFMGHSGDGHILLQKGGHEAAESAKNFAITLQRYRTLRLLVFASCESSLNTDPLIQSQGVPAVIAMQYDLPNDSAPIFTETFYGRKQEGLLEGVPIDLAVNAARRKLHLTDTSQTLWGCPTVSVNSPAALECFIARVVPGNSGSGVRPSVPGSRWSRGHRSDTQPLPIVVAPVDQLATEAPASLVTEGFEIGRAHQTEVSALTFVGDEHILVSGSADPALRAWQIDPTPPLIGEPASSHPGLWTGFNGKIAVLHSVAESQNLHSVLSAGEDLNLTLWNWRDGTSAAKTRFPPTIVQAVASDPRERGGLALVTDGGKLVYTHDVRSFLDNPNQVRSFDVGGRGHSVAFRADGTWLAATSQRSDVPVWHRAAEGFLVDHVVDLAHTSDESVQAVTGVAPNRFVTGTLSGNLNLWEVGSPPRTLQRISWRREGVNRLVWLASHKLLLTGSASAIALWRMADRILEVPIWLREVAGGTVTSMTAFSEPNGTIIAVGLSSGSIILYYLGSHPMDTQ